MRKRNVWLMIFAVYLLLLAVLTVFSSEILRVSLPQVQTRKVQSMYLDGTYYAQVIEQKAIQHGENGASFIWAVEKRQTPLGNRSYIKKIPVTVRYLEKERMLCAVEGAIQGEADIVCEWNAELKEGQEVRAVESSSDFAGSACETLAKSVPARAKHES